MCDILSQTSHNMWDLWTMYIKYQWYQVCTLYKYQNYTWTEPRIDLNLNIMPA